MDNVWKKQKANHGIILKLAINLADRPRFCRQVQKGFADVKAGLLSIEEIDFTVFEAYLDQRTYLRPIF